ncbi:hypothetical protein H0H87_006445 [Tephrocybe sp. NHM501043]|nr:hypothetical protein H0H87_006445 [Tephrocybe sp. NHM501043]
MSNSSTPFFTDGAPFNPDILDPGTFVPPTSTIVCNTLWFLSLSFSLVCALSATLVEQWARDYLQATESRHAPHERARICSYLYRGLEKFKMASLVEVIPMLLHVSLLLFFAGLVIFLQPVNTAISYIVLAVLVTCVMFYGLATILPIIQFDCPYHTPLSHVLWKIMKFLRVLRRYDLQGQRVVVSGSMSAAREIEATQISAQRDWRDLSAMTWSLKNLRHESEFQSFLENIPQVVAGHDYSAKLLLSRLLYHKDPSARLGHRIPRLLISCTGGVLDTAVAQKRAATCLAAIWSLSMMAVHTDPWETPMPAPSDEKRRFDDFTLRDIETVRIEIPAIADYAISASTSIARGLLDRWLEHTVNQEILLNDFIASDGTKNLSYNFQLSGSTAPLDRIKYDSPERVIRVIRHNLTALSVFLSSGRAIATSNAIVLFSTAYIRIVTLLDQVAHSTHKVDTLNLASQALSLLREFRIYLNQAGLSVLADYASSFHGGRSLPYEAFKTLRRLFIKLDLEQHVSPAMQSRLISCLDDTLDPEGGVRVPQSIVNILLGLAKAVDDPTCALKAKTLIKRNMRFFVSQEEADKALEKLDRTLPPPPPTLDLFTSHMYSNVKVDRGQRLLGTVSLPHATLTPRRHETY